LATLTNSLIQVSTNWSYNVARQYTAVARRGGGNIKDRIDDDITISDRRTYRPTPTCRGDSKV